MMMARQKVVPRRLLSYPYPLLQPGEPSEIAKMKVDPTMCMKTLESRTKRTTNIRAFCQNIYPFYGNSRLVEDFLAQVAPFAAIPLRRFVGNFAHRAQ